MTQRVGFYSVPCSPRGEMSWIMSSPIRAAIGPIQEKPN